MHEAMLLTYSGRPLDALAVLDPIPEPADLRRRALRALGRASRHCIAMGKAHTAAERRPAGPMPNRRELVDQIAIPGPGIHVITEIHALADEGRLVDATALAAAAYEATPAVATPTPWCGSATSWAGARCCRARSTRPGAGSVRPWPGARSTTSPGRAVWCCPPWRPATPSAVTPRPPRRRWSSWSKLPALPVPAGRNRSSGGPGPWPPPAICPVAARCCDAGAAPPRPQRIPQLRGGAAPRRGPARRPGVGGGPPRSTGRGVRGRTGGDLCQARHRGGCPAGRRLWSSVADRFRAPMGATPCSRPRRPPRRPKRWQRAGDRRVGRRPRPARRDPRQPVRRGPDTGPHRSGDRRSPHLARARHRHLRGPGPLQQGHRRRAVPVRPDGEQPPPEHLLEARGHRRRQLAAALRDTPAVSDSPDR